MLGAAPHTAATHARTWTRRPPKGCALAVPVLTAASSQEPRGGSNPESTGGKVAKPNVVHLHSGMLPGLREEGDSATCHMDGQGGFHAERKKPVTMGQIP